MKAHRNILAAALALGALASAAPALAQIAQPAIEIAPGNTLLTVTGEGRSFREPDMAVFSAGVTTQGDSAAAALAENSRAMTQVIAALKRAGIAERDIQTNNLSITPVYADPNRDAMMAARVSGQPYVPPPPDQRVPQIIGYQASNNVSVRQRDLDDFGTVIDTLAAAGANQINGPMFQMDDADPALDEARLDAVRSARQRAELYARATGLRIVRILSIAEGGGYYGPPPMVFARAYGEAASAPPPPPPAPVQPGELQMTANVTVLYELAPG
ncbi:MAG TPA: SIMPL domain-containing protein [Croceibacterium sp.]|nr:SIMPL domain-containing protein [Croceibacterium sp.]